MRHDLHVRPFGPDPQLVRRGRPERVRGREDHPFALRALSSRQLADRRGLAGPIHADDEHHGRWRRGSGEVPCRIAREQLRLELASNGRDRPVTGAALARAFDDLHGERGAEVARDERFLDVRPGLRRDAVAGQQAPKPRHEPAAAPAEAVLELARALGVLDHSAPRRRGQRFGRGAAGRGARAGATSREGGGLVEAEADDAAHGVVADRDAVQRVGRLDRAPVVRDDDALGVARELAERVGEPADVGLVERGVDLVEHAEGNGPDLEHREQEGDRGQGPLAAGEHRERLGLLARRARRDLDAGRGQVLGIGQGEAGVATTEELLEALVERSLERLERPAELVRDQPVQLPDELPRVLDGGLEVRALDLEPVEARLDLRVLVRGERVDGAEVVEPAAQGRQLRRCRRLACRRRRGPARPPRASGRPRGPPARGPRRGRRFPGRRMSPLGAERDGTPSRCRAVGPSAASSTSSCSRRPSSAILRLGVLALVDAGPLLGDPDSFAGGRC